MAVASASAGLTADLRERARPGALSRIWTHPAGRIGILITILLILVAAGSPLLAPQNPIHQVPGRELRPPSELNWLGTDELGRDILSRIIWGSRVSLIVGLLAVALGSTVGVLSGLIAGYLGGWVDAVIMRLTDSLLAFPAILLGIAVATVLGPGATNAAIALAIVSVPQFARIARACVLTERGKDYVLAALALGARDSRVLAVHILPNGLAPLLIQLSLAMAYAVLLEAGLSFLGLGAQPPEPSWGQMLSTARNYLRQAPWYGVFPGVALTILLFGLNFLADGVRDALDPRRSVPR